MLDDRAEAILLEAMSTLSGGETVAVTRHGRAGLTDFRAGELEVWVSHGLGVLPELPETTSSVHYTESSGDLAPDDVLLGVQVFDAYLAIASHIQEMPGAVAMNDETRGRIKTVREKLRGMI